MRFQLDITLSEEDYISYNRFHSFESSFGKKQIVKGRIMYICIIVLFSVLVFLYRGWSGFMILYLTLVGLSTVVFMLLYKKIICWSLNSQIKRLKKLGKLPYPPACKLEFYDDMLVEITDTTRSERKYQGLERICVIKDRFVFLYDSTMSAFILPMPQVNAQVDAEEFFAFLKQKCSNMEYC